MRDSSSFQPFTPPPAPPADLVIDTFGTFLGKRSGRMVVRWHEPNPALREASPSVTDVNDAAPQTTGAADSEREAPPVSRTDDDDPSRRADRPQSRQTATVLRFPGRANPQEGTEPEAAPAEGSAASSLSECDSRSNPSADGSSEKTRIEATDHDDDSNAPAADAPDEHAAIADAPDEHAPDAVAARLLTLWQRKNQQSAPRKPVREPTRFNQPRPPSDASGPADEADSPSSRNRFQRLDDSLRELDAAFDDTPQTTWRHREVPLDRLKSVVVASRGVSISSDLIEALVERGVQLSFLSSRGSPVAHLNSPALAATVQTRRSQLVASSSRIGVELAAAFIDGKLRNQRNTLLYFGKYLKATAPERYRVVFEKSRSLHSIRKQLKEVATSPPRRAVETSLLDMLRDRMMGFEGAGARCYWEAFAVIVQGRAEFPGRETRGAIDPINSALNYGYGILYSKVFAAIVNAGLEPYAGFLHVDRPGKPSLVLDLVEEFRAPIVDRAILAIVNQGVVLSADAHGLVLESRRLVAERVLERIDKPVPFEGKRHRVGAILQMQARHLATAVRGERTYKPFCSRW